MADGWKRKKFLEKILGQYDDDAVYARGGYVCPRCGCRSDYAHGPCEGCVEDLWNEECEADEVATEKVADRKRDERRT